MLPHSAKERSVTNKPADAVPFTDAGNQLQHLKRRRPAPLHHGGHVEPVPYLILKKMLRKFHTCVRPCPEFRLFLLLLTDLGLLRLHSLQEQSVHFSSCSSACFIYR